MPLAATQMDLEIVILNEVSQNEKDKYHITYMRHLKIQQKWTYPRKRSRLTDIENRLVVAKGEGRIGSLGIVDANYYT